MTYTHWFTATAAVSTRNHGLTSTASSTLSRVTLPASAKSTRSRGQRRFGIGAGLIGLHPQGFVDAWAPLFFFALLFGLSMDYQLFLLAAIRERYEQSGNTTVAVTEGIARTGRPITNAALIMIVVFIAFGVTGPIPPTELGVTRAMAVLLDATIVRVMLVPATMALLGDRNWYAPKWLQKVLPHIDFSH